MTHYPKPDMTPEVLGDPLPAESNPDPRPEEVPMAPSPLASKEFDSLPMEEPGYDPKLDPKPWARRKEEEGPTSSPNPEGEVKPDMGVRLPGGPM